MKILCAQIASSQSFAPIYIGDSLAHDPDVHHIVPYPTYLLSPGRRSSLSPSDTWISAQGEFY